MLQQACLGAACQLSGACSLNTRDYKIVYLTSSLSLSEEFEYCKVTSVELQWIFTDKKLISPF